jgi:K+-sensing histidine kinase KdpD
VNNFISQGEFKEVIVFYPSIHNPQKVISLFYPLAPTVHTDDINNLDQSHAYSDIHQQFIHYMIDDIKASVNVISGYNDLQLINTENGYVTPYNQPINESCSHILRSISDVMQVYKISSNISSLEQSIFSCEDIVNECLEHFNTYTLNNQVRITLELNTNGLLIISDKKIFYDGLIKILDSIMRSSQKPSRLKIKIIDDVELEKISLIIIDESQLNIENIIKTDAYDIFNNPTMRNTGSLNFKIAEHYLKLLKCHITAVNHNERGNILTIEISDDMITSIHERDSDNLAI